MAGEDRARTEDPMDGAQPTPASEGSSRAAEPTGPSPSTADIEAILRRVAYCRDEARELNLQLVEYVLGLARHELSRTLRQMRSRGMA